MAEYDDQEAVAFIREYTRESVPSSLDEDVIYEIIDLTFDYFDELGDDDDVLFVELDENGKVVPDEQFDHLYNYVYGKIQKESPFGLPVDFNQLKAIVDGELAYETSLEEE